MTQLTSSAKNWHLFTILSHFTFNNDFIDILMYGHNVLEDVVFGIVNIDEQI